jgi:hypothetical protein
MANDDEFLRATLPALDLVHNLVLAVVAGGLLAGQDDAGQPAVIAAAVASYRTGHLDK